MHFIQYILKETGAERLTYIGFSQGSAQAFACLSINQDIAKKVNLFIALAPAARVKRKDSILLR
jgi:lysosomal acid lipase/cholesteryl ester hydrolase